MMSEWCRVLWFGTSNKFEQEVCNTPFRKVVYHQQGLEKYTQGYNQIKE